MKTFIKIVVTLLVILILAFLGMYVFVNLKGKVILTNKIQQLTKKNTQVKSVSLRFPWNIEIDKLEIEGIAKIDRIFIIPSIFGFLTGNPAFNEIRIEEAEFTFKRGLASQDRERPIKSKEIISLRLKRPPLNFIFRKIVADKIKFNLVDYTNLAEGFKVIIKDASLYIENLLFFPVSIVTHFNFKGSIPWPNKTTEGKIYLYGWVNLYRKDMQAHLEVNDIDGIYFYPYYRNWVDLEKARIKEATLNFISDISGLNDNVVANCSLELVDIIFKPESENGSQDRAYRIAQGILELFKKMEDKKRITFNFTVHTKMTEPEFRLDNIRIAFEDKINMALKSGNRKTTTHIFSFPADFLKGTVKGTLGVTKILVESTVDISKALAEIFVGSFKKESAQETRH